MYRFVILFLINFCSLKKKFKICRYRYLKMFNDLILVYSFSILYRYKFFENFLLYMDIYIIDIFRWLWGVILKNLIIFCYFVK